MSSGSGDVTKYLERLEEAIDLDWERRKLAEWKRVLEFEPLGEGERFEAYASGRQPGERGEWPSVTVNEAIESPERMLLQQLGSVYGAVCDGSYWVPNIRTNYGTGIIANVFGAEMFWMDEGLNTLPTTRPLEGDDAIGGLIAAGMPELTSGLGGRCFETLEYFEEAMRPYPKISEVVWIYHPDLQGPIDNVELLWGSPMYLAFYEEPEKVKAVTQLVTDTYVALLDRWMAAHPEPDPVYFAHWGNLFKGHVMLRNDTIVNLSPEMYLEFVKPYDERVLERYGGGGIHFCGRADHCIELMTDSENLTAINMSQPHLNDMRKIFDATVGKGVILNCHPTDEIIDELDLSLGVTLR